MATFKALLIGAEAYGEGFVALPAVKRDVELMESALRGAGYDVERCEAAVVEDPRALDHRIRDFCAAAGADDVRIVYFSGHGVRVGGHDWIVPAGVKREDALVSFNDRVSTDLSDTVATSKAGLVVWIIDACRDRAGAPVAKGGSGWGDPDGLNRPGESRFIRFFGCAADQVCQVVEDFESGAPVSLFTSAIASSLADPSCQSLKDLLTRVAERSREILGLRPQLVAQSPRLSYGETASQTEVVLERRLFWRSRSAASLPVWPVFDPQKLHCLVVLSEYQAQHADHWSPSRLLRRALAGKEGDRIWKAFRDARAGQTLASGRQRTLGESVSDDAVVFAELPILDAYADGDAFDAAVRAVVEADLVVFDVTGDLVDVAGTPVDMADRLTKDRVVITRGFEPGVMLLAGIRSATRRGLSICSHGAGWLEGQPLEIPFNLQDLNLNSHTQSADPLNPYREATDRFVKRVEAGFLQMERQPSYLDLPGYDALRQLGSDYAASSTIPVHDQVLVLCSYEKSFLANWTEIEQELTIALSARRVRCTKIQRVIDYGTPQLVLQGLYEQIRRAAACLADWSARSPSVFLEIGARLAASEWGAVQIVDRRFATGGPQAGSLAQMALMQRLLDPIVYGPGETGAFGTIADALIRPSPNVNDPTAPGFNRVYHVLLKIIHAVHEASPPLARDLSRRADALHHHDQGQKSAPQILFSGNRSIKQDAEKAAAEFRVAAWLYLEHRVGEAHRKADPQTAALYKVLGEAASEALYDLGDDESMALADTISNRLEDESLRTMPAPDERLRFGLDAARAARKKGDALRTRQSDGTDDDVAAAYDSGRRTLQRAIESAADAERQLMADAGAPSQDARAFGALLIEAYGALGGLLQRLGRLAEARERYAAGGRLEDALDVPSTYNRLNAVRLELLTDPGTPLQVLQPRIAALADRIRRALDDDQSLSDSGWAWADLGDCLTLLAHTEEAARAYATFVAKAEIKSPERTLDVLRQIAAKLQARGDVGAAALDAAVTSLADRMRGTT